MSVSSAVSIRVRGLVQGVGFRPTVWRIATEHALVGEVLNDGEGVVIRLWGTPSAQQTFVERLRSEAPPLSRIDAIEITPISDVAPFDDAFQIVDSEAGEVSTGVVPDAATCPACAAEVRDLSNRRYHYPFTNCTHCGPRLSIVRGIPYDRSNTSMVAFPLCLICRREYEDQANRRFHAQPNACPVCGPRIWLEEKGGEALDVGDVIGVAAKRIEEGAIVAIKGIGGFHLACDATNETAVAELRRRKHRYQKAFALMARDEAMISRYAQLREGDRTALSQQAAPVVVMDAREDTGLAPSIAPGQATLGFMLPYTPLHGLLADALDTPFVVTSGNRSEEPQCIDNGQAQEKLAEITDLFLMHDRVIVNRLDDSVVRVMDGEPRLLRRARGYAPASILLPEGFEQAPPITALGGDLKSTFCLLRDGQAILSQHLGDLEETATFSEFQATLDLYEALFQHTPERIVVDLHPGYLSSRFGRELARSRGLPLVEVQHHHAHIAACLAENGWALDAPPVLGIALDGLGYGEDGSLWGGEFLLGDYRGFQRVACLRPVSMIGGDKASSEPWRNTYAQLSCAFTLEHLQEEYADLPLMAYLQGKPRQILDRMLKRGLNSPLTSSAGRLFDAVAAALDICRERIEYEGQAAVEMEMLLETGTEEGLQPYPFGIDRSTPLTLLDPKPMWQELLQDLRRGRGRGAMVARFHWGLADTLTDLAGEVCQERGIGTVVLSGGVFQNRPLFERMAASLRRGGLQVLSHRQVPANDGGLSLGQVVIAAAREPVTS